MEICLKKLQTYGFSSQFFTGNADEAIRLYRNALRVIKDSNYMAMDDRTIEKIRIDLAELLHLVGR